MTSNNELQKQINALTEFKDGLALLMALSSVKADLTQSEEERMNDFIHDFIREEIDDAIYWREQEMVRQSKNDDENEEHRFGGFEYGVK